jgi:hypothetical protein
MCYHNIVNISASFADYQIDEKLSFIFYYYTMNQAREAEISLLIEDERKQRENRAAVCILICGTIMGIVLITILIYFDKK